SAIADEGDADAAVAAIFGGECRAAGKRRAGAQDAVGAHHALGKIGDVHRAALAPAGAGRLAVDLAHHVADIDALGDAVAMAAMGRGDAIAIVEMYHDAGGGGLLAGVKMDEAGNVALGKFIWYGFFEFANEPLG